MVIKTTKDYLDELQEHFPDIERESLKYCVNECLRSIVYLTRHDYDVKLRNEGFNVSFFKVVSGKNYKARIVTLMRKKDSFLKRIDDHIYIRVPTKKLKEFKKDGYIPAGSFYFRSITESKSPGYTIYKVHYPEEKFNWFNKLEEDIPFSKAKKI